MKAGDLVDFHTDAWVFDAANKRYANPGVVLSVDLAPPQNRAAAEILWADGQITREYDSFLRPREKKNKNA
jgi:hypothetical protein